MDGDDDKAMLWHDMKRLAGVAEPRIWHWESAAGPSAGGKPSPNFSILGDESTFGRPEFMRTVLDLVRRELDLDIETWRAQREFLIEFACSLYGTSDRPAWIKVQAVRKGFARRLKDAGGRPGHYSKLYGAPIPLVDIRSSPVLLGDYSLRLGHLPDVRPDNSGPTMRLQMSWVGRTLRGSERKLEEHEWRFVMVSDDPSDCALASAGITPFLSSYRDAGDVHNSPLISFCRLDEHGRAAHRVFSIHPRTGMICDLRVCAYVPEYYFRSDMTCHVMLENLASNGRHEAF